MYKYPDASLAKNLKRILAEKGISQSDFAKTLGRERKTVYSWINCLSSPSAYDLKVICMTYRVSADELLGIKK